MEFFDLAIIGSGSGNTIVDERFDGLNVAMIERNPVYGGTCLNVGCIPTKMFVIPADFATSATEAARVSVDLDVRGAYFERARDRIFSRIDPISRGGYEYRSGQPNVTVFTEQASFVEPHVLAVGDGRIEAARIVVAAGSRPRIPDLAGLDSPELEGRIHTSDTIMRVDRLPESLIIWGGGDIAVEFAHIFSGFGSSVTMINRSGRLLRHEDDDIAARLTDALSERVAIRLNQRPVRVTPMGDGLSLTTVDNLGVEYHYDAEAMLVAVGRVPNSDALNLDAAGIRPDQRGLIPVDGQQRTGVAGIWALGDVSSPFQLKHVANAEARTVQHNLLVDITGEGTPVESDHRFVPHGVFTHPQIAAVGPTQAELDDAGRPYVVATQEYSSVAYGWAMEDQAGLVKLLADPDSKQLLGAHIIGAQAATLIQPLVQAMSFGLDAPAMARGQYWLHPGLPEVVENALLSLKF